MNSLALLALVFAAQAAGQGHPGGAPTVAPVPAGLPTKYTAIAPGPGSAVAKVDGQLIYAHDVESLLWESLGPQAVEDIITLVTIRRAAVERGVKVAPADIEKRLKEDLVMYDTRTKQGQQPRPPGMSVEQFLGQHGLPLSRLYLQAELETTLDKIAERTFQPDSYVKVSLMMFRSTAATPAANDIAQKNANAAAAKLKGGAKWETVMTSSQMPAEYMKTGGLLGWLDYATFPPDVISQVKPLMPGQMSAPIKISTPGQQAAAAPAVYEIFRVEQLGSKAVGDDLTQLKKRYTQGEQQKLLKTIRDAAKVERFPVQEPVAAATTSPTKTTTPKK